MSNTQKQYLTYTQAYEDQDSIGDEDALWKVFNIDLEDPESIGATLSSLLDKLQDEDFMEEVEDDSRFPQFAIVKNQAIEELYYAPEEIYLTAAKYIFLRPLLKDICEQIIDLQSDCSGSVLWEDDDNPLGLTPAFALAMKDQKYIWLFTQMLSAPRNDFSYDSSMIQRLMERWGACEDMSILMAMLGTNVRTQGFDGDVKLMMHAGFDVYFKNEEHVDAFIRSWTACAMSNRFFQERHQPQMLRIFREVVATAMLRDVLHFGDNAIEKLMPHIEEMVEHTKPLSIHKLRAIAE